VAGRVAIVTGGGGGIGSATARLFCEEGARVVIADANTAAVEAAAARIRGDVPAADILALTGDVSREEDAERVVAAAREAFGEIAILVNNAAIREYLPIAEATRETWERVLGVNLLGAANFSKAALPSLRRSKGASIVNVSSTYGVTGRAGMGQYDAAKAALLALTRTLAFEEAAHGVRVNAICPGYTLTPFHVERARVAGRSEAELRAEHVEACLLHRWADPREVAFPILWLASDEASYVTASTFMIDGGRPYL
jgi:meso-butanediol dehydrogenase/(S,S)-butanediol dehydrogenase/diacetyl reductase